LTFHLPAGAQAITLRSSTFIPANSAAGKTDTRELGLCVAGLRIDGEAAPLADDAALGDGWHPAERQDGEFKLRWTRGAAALPPGARSVIVDLAGFGHYWRRCGHADTNAAVLRLDADRADRDRTGAPVRIFA